MTRRLLPASEQSWQGSSGSSAGSPGAVRDHRGSKPCSGSAMRPGWLAVGPSALARGLRGILGVRGLGLPHGEGSAKAKWWPGICC